MFKRLKSPFEKEQAKGYQPEESYSSVATSFLQEQDADDYESHNSPPPRVFEMRPKQEETYSSRTTDTSAYTKNYREPMLDLEEELEEQDAWEDSEPLSSEHKPSFLDEEPPETTIGQGVTIRGELEFERLIRIDGTFEGKLISTGKLIVGPSGAVKSNINLSEAIIEGKVEGNMQVQGRLELRGEAQVLGDITAKTLSVDEGVTIIGEVRVSPIAEEEAPKD